MVAILWKLLLLLLLLLLPLNYQTYRYILSAVIWFGKNFSFVLSSCVLHLFLERFSQPHFRWHPYDIYCCIFADQCTLSLCVCVGLVCCHILIIIFIYLATKISTLDTLLSQKIINKCARNLSIILHLWHSLTIQFCVGVSVPVTSLQHAMATRAFLPPSFYLTN